MPQNFSFTNDAARLSHIGGTATDAPSTAASTSPGRSLAPSIDGLPQRPVASTGGTAIRPGQQDAVLNTGHVHSDDCSWMSWCQRADGDPGILHGISSATPRGASLSLDVPDEVPERHDNADGLRVIPASADAVAFTRMTDQEFSELDQGAMTGKPPGGKRLEECRTATEVLGHFNAMYRYLEDFSVPGWLAGVAHKLGVLGGPKSTSERAAARRMSDAVLRLPEHQQQPAINHLRIDWFAAPDRARLMEQLIDHATRLHASNRLYGYDEWAAQMSKRMEGSFSVAKPLTWLLRSQLTALEPSDAARARARIFELEPAAFQAIARQFHRPLDTDAFDTDKYGWLTRAALDEAYARSLMKIGVDPTMATYLAGDAAQDRRDEKYQGFGFDDLPSAGITLEDAERSLRESSAALTWSNQRWLVAERNDPDLFALGQVQRQYLARTGNQSQ
jgi:hypothetical protein